MDQADRPPLEGRSLAPVASAKPDPDPWPQVWVSYGGVETVISDDGWRLTCFPEGKGQLFNLFDDPGEQHNLYKDPSHVEVRQRLLAQLVYAMSRPGTVPHYRTMPEVDGAKRIPVKGRLEGEVPVY